MKGDICKIDGCEKVIAGKGLICRGCWHNKMQYGSFTAERTPRKYPVRPDVCKIDDCNNRLKFASHICGSCQKKKARYGSYAQELKPAPTLQERFWSKVDKTDSCWLFKSYLSRGYARMTVDKKSVGAHRVSWMLHNGDIPRELFVLHKCDVRNCVNPSHLFLGTNQDNMDDMVNKGRHVPQHMKGEHHPLAKLKEKEVKKIKKLLKGEAKTIDLAKKFNVSRQAISQIKNNRTWSHVE